MRSIPLRIHPATPAMLAVERELVAKADDLGTMSNWVARVAACVSVPLTGVP